MSDFDEIFTWTVDFNSAQNAGRRAGSPENRYRQIARWAVGPVNFSAARAISDPPEP
jgi:hypothetical protein